MVNTLKTEGPLLRTIIRKPIFIGDRSGNENRLESTLWREFRLRKCSWNRERNEISAWRNRPPVAFPMKLNGIFNIGCDVKDGHVYRSLMRNRLAMRARYVPVIDQTHSDKLGRRIEDWPIGRYVSSLAHMKGAGRVLIGSAHQFVRATHLAGLITSKDGIEENDDHTKGFYWLRPRLILGSLIDFLGITLATVLAFVCATCGLSVVKYEVTRQPDADAAWVTFWIGAAILAIGQGFVLLAVYLVSLWV